MKRLAFKIMSRVGTLLTHRQRRFLLDRLGLSRLVGRIAEHEYDEVALHCGITITINSIKATAPTCAFPYKSTKVAR